MGTAAPERKLAAIMVADIAGFSRLMEGAEADTFERVRRLREEVSVPSVNSFGGRVIKSTGDGFLAEFSSAVSALRCAIDIQRSLMALEADHPLERRLRLRIGINVGDIILDGSDVAGDGVNVAARLEAMAPVDGICISSMVQEQIRDDLGVAYQDLGPQQLKNISRPVHAFVVHVDGRVLPAGAKALPAKARLLQWRLAGVAAAVALVLGAGAFLWKSPLSSAGQGLAKGAAPKALVSILVLPFANGSGDPAQAYLADGLTATLSADISRIRDAYVVSSANAMQLKDKAVDPVAIGKEFGVRFLLQGSVQRAGEHIRVNAQLIDATNGAQLWAENFDGDPANFFALQDKVTNRIGSSIGREMVITAARESEQRSGNPEVTDLTLRLRALMLKPRSPANIVESEKAARAIIEMDPQNANALAVYATVSLLHARYFGHTMTVEQRTAMLAEANAMAVKAQARDATLPMVYAALAGLAEARGDYDGMLRATETFAELDPKNPVAINFLAHALIYGAETKRSREILLQAYQRDPAHPLDLVLFNLGWGNFVAGDDAAAIEWFKRVLTLNPTFFDAHMYLAMAHMRRGDAESARAELEAWKKADPTASAMTRRRPLAQGPAAYREYYEKTLLPTAQKAGVIKS